MVSTLLNHLASSSVEAATALDSMEAIVEENLSALIPHLALIHVGF